VAGGAGGLANGGNNLCSGQPHQRRRPPQHRRQQPPLHRRPPPPRTKRSSLPPSYGVRTRPSKNAATTSAAYDALYDPLGQRRSSAPRMR
jgi:hypothetical protein